MNLGIPAKAAVIASVLAITSGCGEDTRLQECIDRGVSYFKEIGSYPTLNSAPNKGRRAEDVARERCSRTYTAF